MDFFHYSRFQEDTICCAESLQELKSGGFCLDAEGITARQLSLGSQPLQQRNLSAFCLLVLAAGIIRIRSLSEKYFWVTLRI